MGSVRARRGMANLILLVRQIYVSAHIIMSLGSGVPYMVRLRPPGLGVKGGPQRRVPIATGPPPGYAASAGARSELAMDCPRGLPTFFQYGAGTSGAAAAPRVPRRGTSGAAAAPQTCAAARARVPECRAHRALLCQHRALCASPALMSSSLDEPTRRLLPRYARGTLEM